MSSPSASTSPALSTTPTADTAPFPPDLRRCVGDAFNRELLNQHPGMRIDVNSTWLVFRGYEPASTGATAATTSALSTTTRALRSLALIDSLLDYVCDHLSLSASQSFAFYSSADPAPNERASAELNPAQILALYQRLHASLSEDYSDALVEYWDVTDNPPLSRRALFIAERMQTTLLECQIGVEHGTFNTSQYAMLDRALRDSQRHDDGVAAHGVFGLALKLPGQLPVLFSAIFVLTHTRYANNLNGEHADPDEVLLYCPNSRLQAFDSIAALSSALTLMLSDPSQRQVLMKHIAREDLNRLNADSSHGIGTAQWAFIALAGDFPSLLFGRQIRQQQADFRHALKLARELSLDYRAFETLLASLLTPEQQFDNHFNLDRHDRRLTHEHMPQWWQKMPEPQRKDWIGTTSHFADAIIELHRAIRDYLDQPELQSGNLIKQHIDQQLRRALAAKGMKREANAIFIDLRYSAPLSTGLSTVVNPDGFQWRLSAARYSLSELAYSDPQKSRLDNSATLSVSDAQGKALSGLDGDDVREILGAINVNQMFEQFLVRHLKTSAFAQTLAEKGLNLMSAQMRLGLIEAKRQGLSERAQEWIQAVLDSPAPKTRRQVGGLDIGVKCVQLASVQLANVMLIGPAHMLDAGSLVLCTLNAPDGVVFREYPSLFNLKLDYLENNLHRHYLSQQLPASQRSDGLTALAYEKVVKHWRLPNIFHALPKPLPIPAAVFNPISYVDEHGHCLKQNHLRQIDQLILDAEAHLLQMRGAAEDYHTNEHLAASIAMLLLPRPIMVPLALGAALFKAWSGFMRVLDNDCEGAAQELLIALNYLATAVIGPLSLLPKLATAAKMSTRAPHLVRIQGRDGQKRIGYLLSPSSAPHLPDGQIAVALDAKKFTAINIDDQAYYVAHRFNMIGHSRLYQASALQPQLLIHEGEYALRRSSGAWIKAVEQRSLISRSGLSQVSRELPRAVASWPMSLILMTGAEQVALSTECAALARVSNTAQLAEIGEYCEGGSLAINHAMRSLKPTAESLSFLRQFYRLRTYHGMAYRAAYISSASLQRMRGQLGTTFSDAGVQSASIGRINAQRWSEDAFVTRNASAGNHPLFLIFDRSIAKKNMSTDFLIDHVAIAPGTHLQLQGLQEVGTRIYAWFGRPEYRVTERFDLYSGARELMV